MLLALPLLLASCASALPLLPARPVPISAAPLYQDPLLFPTIFAGARYVAYFLNPAFQATIGAENVWRLDSVVAHFCLCVFRSYWFCVHRSDVSVQDRV